MRAEEKPVVRAAGAADLRAVSEIYGHYVTNSVVTFELSPPDGQEWARRHRSVLDEGLPFLVAEVGGRTAGYAYCSPWKSRPAYGRTVEDSVYVAPWAARRGIGGALLDELLARCVTAQVREVIAVVVDTGDPGSTALHSARGFVEAGRLTGVGYKHGRWLDTVLLQRSLH